jgi:hypothetical protein
MGINATNGFDGWLARELQQHASQVAGSNPLPSQARYHAVAIAGTALGAISFAILSTKTVTAAAISVVAIVAAGATTEAVITHSANPAVWGHQVVQQVENCKAALPPGGNGIGECVSSFASQHGKQEKTKNEASSPNPNGNGGSSNGHPAGGPPSDHPHGAPSSHPTPGNGGGNGGGNSGGNSGNGNGNGGGNGHGKP